MRTALTCLGKPTLLPKSTSLHTNFTPLQSTTPENKQENVFVSSVGTEHAVLQMDFKQPCDEAPCYSNPTAVTKNEHKTARGCATNSLHVHTPKNTKLKGESEEALPEGIIDEFFRSVTQHFLIKRLFTQFSCFNTNCLK